MVIFLPQGAQSFTQRAQGLYEREKIEKNIDKYPPHKDLLT